ncbi:c-type cytochrome [Magnetococcales bacterium HHB-1]
MAIGMKHKKRTLPIGSVMIIALLLFSISSMVEAAGMYHGPSGSSPITGLPKNPSVPFQFGLGMQKFKNNCADCHGQWAEGTVDKGPPLIHPYYEPSHHGDDAFFRAVLSGVNAHHWSFGDMPPVADVTKQDVGQIVQFIRWWQRENGIR